MKNLKRILAASALAGGAAMISHAAPFLAVGDGAEVFFTGTVGIRYDSNIFLAPHGAEDDTIFSVDPGLLFSFGKGSDTTGTIAVQENWDLYSTHNGLNTHLFQGDFASNYDNDKTKANLSAFYHELNQNDLNIRNLARRNEANVSAGGEVQLAEKESLGVGVVYDDVHFETAGYSSSDTYTVPINGFYAVTPKVDLSAGYRYRHVDNTIGADEDDDYFNVGARGEFTPKLTGSFDVGYEDATYKTIGKKPTSDNIGYDANLAYAYTEKTNFTLTGSNSFTTDSFGNEEKNFTLALRGTTAFLDELNGFAQIAYQHNQYTAAPSRTDNYYDSSVGVTYALNRYVTFQGQYTYRTNDSTLDGAQFNDNVLAVSASFKY